MSNHDPALGSADKREFMATLDELFLQGRIFLAPSESAPGESAAPAGESAAPAAEAAGDAVGADAADPVAAPIRAKTLTQIAMEQMAPMRVFYYGTKTKILWSRTARADAQAALTSMQDVVKATQGRVDADLYERDTLMLLEVFNLSEWLAVRKMNRDPCPSKTAQGKQRHSALVRKLRLLAKNLGRRGRHRRRV